MAYLVHASEGGRIEIRESDEPDAVSLGTALRLAKILAGWEVRINAGHRPPIYEPVCRNLRSEHGCFTPRASRA